MSRRNHISHPCPCCGFETLSTAPGDTVCVLCWWDDFDQQGDHDAHLDLGGANSGYTLHQARANFRDHGDIFDDSDPCRIDVVTHPTSGRMALVAYASDVLAGRRVFNKSEFERLRQARGVTSALKKTPPRPRKPGARLP